MGAQILITCLCGLTDCLHVHNELTVPIKILESGFVWDLCISVRYISLLMEPGEERLYSGLAEASWTSFNL